MAATKDLPAVSREEKRREEERKVERSGKTEKRQVMDIGESKVRPKASSYGSRVICHVSVI